MLTLSHLTRRYGSLIAVDDVSLRLPAGARHAVIGPNGAGKTTLLNLIAGTDRADSGQILLAAADRSSGKDRADGAEGAIDSADADITRMAAARRSRLGIARSYQQPSVIAGLTVLDNIMLAGWRHHRAGRAAWRRPSRRRLLRELALNRLDTVGLAELADQPAGGLSHGQRRMLDIAAAMAGQPRLLLLDEPAAGLTDRDIGRLVGLLRDIPAEVALLLVEHHIEVVTELADTVTVLAAGGVLVNGSTQEALSHPEVREIYLDTVPASVEAPTRSGSGPVTGARG
ncbi:ABC transporter ATP-binding protein [Streptomyces albidus (ex Kaewkla and Franco 2022)]|uniref:ABC transporter ATP-binding protein n=1 Tax=Streptomyces albidus (ex Kaewkla and Franco 2022) TaxID=722709 RepID=UPI0015EF8773|nr:ATP-binding cassette domain-containing protein [Streptomyces albidus (ex Kaewkla and Franco 2022)]